MNVQTLNYAKIYDVDRDVVQWFIDNDVFRKIDPGSNDESVFDCFSVEGVIDDIGTGHFKLPQNSTTRKSLKELLTFCKDQDFTWIELHPSEPIEYECNQLATSYWIAINEDEEIRYKRGLAELQYLARLLSDYSYDYRITWNDEGTKVNIQYPIQAEKRMTLWRNEFHQAKEVDIPPTSKNLSVYRTNEDIDGGRNLIVIEAENEREAQFFVHSNGYGQIQAAYDCTGMRFDVSFDLIYIDLGSNENEYNLYYFIHTWGLDV